ncbi:hypothetical protein BC834DRAFT_889872 [Gloeopeniophorella convolvens]|nr:hypothetical protein BC834DRAFT_889872 [Gloeopeniophorella convolvens]
MMASSAAAPPFTFGERVGLVLLAQTAGASACAIAVLLSYIAYSAVCVTRHARRRWRIEGPAEVLFLNQLFWDLLQAVGGLMNIRWAADASVHPGTYCSAQGAVKQLSDVGTALSMLAISIYTFVTLCFCKAHTDDQTAEEKERERKRGILLTVIGLALLWASLALLATVNIGINGAQRFYGPAGYWCWIRDAFPVQRTATDFVFMWITAAFNTMIYAVLFIYFRGYITTNGWHMHISRRREPVSTLGTRKEAYGLLFYPLVYMVNVLPLSAVRYSTFAHHHVPFGVVIATDAVYLASGLFNVLLFALTRPFLLPHDPPRLGSASETSHEIRVIGASHYAASSTDGDSAYYGGSWLGHGFPRSESPAEYCPSPEPGEAAGAQAEVSHEKLVVMNGSVHSLDAV